MKFISRLFADTAIRISGGRADSIKGRKNTPLLADLSSLAERHGIERGEVWIDQTGGISFSNGIPETMHQRIRNIAASHTR